MKRIVVNCTTGEVTEVPLTPAEAVALAQPPPPPDPQIATDKSIVATFMGATSGTATAVQRDDITKAVIRYLRRMGQEA